MYCAISKTKGAIDISQSERNDVTRFEYASGYGSALENTIIKSASTEVAAYHGNMSNNAVFEYRICCI
jgi:hypothetical protein